MLHDLLGAAQFLTRVPIRRRIAPDPARSVPWFPVVGALIGAAAGGVAAVSSEVLPAPVAATLAVLAGLLVTGAFHEDGLADTADAMGGTNPAQRREILRDSRHGSYGVAALTGSIVLRVACVGALVSTPAAAFGGLVAAHSLGRGAAVGAMGVVRPAPGSGLGADLVRAVSARRAAGGVLLAIVLAALTTGWWVAPLAAAAALGAALVVAVAVRAFGGVTGDVLGAIEQVGECAVLVVASGVALRHDLWWA